jgi:signal transduction histidine kinase
MSDEQRPARSPARYIRAVMRLGSMRRELTSPLDDERRSILPIQIVMRWGMVALALLLINYEPRSEGLTRLALDVSVVFAASLNALLQWRLATHRVIPVALPVLIGVYDAAAVTVSMRMVEGFDNLNFIIYYPTLLAFTLLFAGRWSLLYAAGTMLLYSAVVATTAHFDAGDPEDVKQLVTRLATMATVVGVAHLAVRIERRLRRRAIDRALAAATERQRVAQEIHDGVAQSVYMLTMSLEANASAIGGAADAPALRERLDALVRLSKQTLIETRALLLDLTPAMSGDQPLSALLDEQAREFATVTGVSAHVTTSGSPAALPPATVGELYRVAQEALANVYKHADATSVELRLSQQPDSVTLEVRDDGRGFDDLADEHGHGLASMRARAARVGGRLMIESTPGRGTRVALKLPTAATVGREQSRG